jgi:hypothetical protein
LKDKTAMEEDKSHAYGDSNLLLSFATGLEEAKCPVFIGLICPCPAFNNASNSMVTFFK